MPLPLIGLALGLASEFVPAAVRWIAGDDAGDVADKVVGIAKSVTGEDDEARVAAALRADPALQIKLQQQFMTYERALFEQETKRLEAVNETMRREITSGDAWVRRWRPTFGYIVALTWLIQAAAVAWSMVADPQYATEVVGAVVALTPMWGVALAVLGINVWKRSEDKRVTAGQATPGLIGALAKRLGGEPQL